jgi:hypothetical protein
MLVMLFHSCGIGVTVSFISTLLIAFPLWILLGLPRMFMGKIGVVRNVAGKARVVGLTNYWLQVALRPVHDGIFRFLKRVPTDGTHDQLDPVRRLRSDSVFSSFDLKAATDRLPLDFQEQVMGLFFGKAVASAWKSLVSFPLRYQSTEIYYSVGQPMGAYSS